MVAWCSRGFPLLQITKLSVLSYLLAIMHSCAWECCLSALRLLLQASCPLTLPCVTHFTLLALGTAKWPSYPVRP